MLKPWFNVFFGLWLFLHGMIGSAIPANPFIIGCALFLIGIWSFKWPSIIIALIGAWTAISAYFSFMQVSAIFIIAGLLVTLLAIIHMSIS